jgi:hypothetical protein
MNNFYYKIAVTSVGIALSFAPGTHKEAKAATFILTETNRYHLADSNQDGLPDWSNTRASLAVGIRYPRGTSEENRAFYEFNLANLSPDSNTVIRSAILEVTINYIGWYRPHSRLEAYGYTENDIIDPLEVYNAGEYLDQTSISLDLQRSSRGIATLNVLSFMSMPKEITTFNVLPFITQRIENNHSFAGFGLRFFNKEGFINLERHAHLIITTAKVTTPVPEPPPIFTEPVPEPTTLFGSAIGICLGGWLKRKKSTLPNKTTSQG